MSLIDHGGSEGHQHGGDPSPLRGLQHRIGPEQVADGELGQLHLQHQPMTATESLQHIFQKLWNCYRCRCNAKNVLQQIRDRQNFFTWLLALGEIIGTFH